MKLNRSVKHLFVMLAVLCPAISGPHISGVVTAASPDPEPKYQTTLKIYGIDQQTGKIGAVLQTLDLPLNQAGISFARHFQAGANHFLLLLKRHSGEAYIRQVLPNGQLGAATGFLKVEQGWTAVDFVTLGGVNYLILHNSFTGEVRTYKMTVDGKIDAGSKTEDKVADYQDKHLFKTYLQNGQWRLFGLDPWTGEAVVYGINGQKIAESTWTRGWTSVDYFNYAGVTYRALFKAAGDPYKGAPDDQNQIHRLVIQKVNADGVTGQNIFDGTLGSPWTSVRFIEMPGDLFVHKLLFYNNGDGSYQTYAFDATKGMGAMTGEGKVKGGYTDLETMNVGNGTFLVGVDEENAKPFNTGQAETMGLAIHEGLKNKAVGYQFLLMQSGKVIYSRAHGYSRLSQGKIAMNSRTRLEMGSVGKMITTMTALKLVEQGKVFLNKPIADQIDPVKYPAPHEWTKQRHLIDLMKHTTGMKTSESADCDAIGETFQVSCKDFFTAAPKLDCVDGLCPWSYNNANFGALRQIIERAAGTKTTAELVDLTHQLWGQKIDFGGQCSDQKNSYEFTDCNGAADCVEHNGLWWLENQYHDPYSTSCGAGGWHASARQMGEFMSAARYAKVLASNINQIFMSTEHEALVDGAPKAGKAAIGWDPPWATDGGEKFLHKNGAAGGARAYITQLPDRMDAVLLVNTSLANHPQGLLRQAYNYAADPIKTPPPVYVEIRPIVSGNSIEITDLSIGSIDDKHYVTAVRQNSGNLRVTGWTMAGNVGAKPGQGVAAGPISDVSVTDGQAFITAVRNGSGDLQVTSWSATVGTTVEVKREADATFGPISKVVATKLSGAGPLLGRFATAVRNGEGKLQVDVWDADNSAKKISRKDTYVAGPISEVAIKMLVYAEGGQTSRFATAVRNGDGHLQVDVWDILANGHIERRGGQADVAVSADGSSRNRIAIGGWGQGNFFTASINGDGKFDMKSWAVTLPGGIVSKKDEYTSGEVLEVAVAADLIVVRLKTEGETNKMKLIYFKFSSTGDINRSGDNTEDVVDQMASNGSLVTAVRLVSAKPEISNRLKLTRWLVVE
ncbi:MAG TPA: serine hydrolase domain-containing protein [Blastocatellia bacterium]|nr:serine hydrolase domain-containing protein [Blastocatellia bacterium]